MLKIYESYQSRLYLQPDAAYVVPDLNEAVGDEFKNNEQKNINIEKLAKKFANCLPLLKNNFIFKEPIIKFHPYSHFSINQTQQVNKNLVFLRYWNPINTIFYTNSKINNN